MEKGRPLKAVAEQGPARRREDQWPALPVSPLGPLHHPHSALGHIGQRIECGIPTPPPGVPWLAWLPETWSDPKDDETPALRGPLKAGSIAGEG